MAKRLLSDWISGYLKFTENTEPAKSYHTWVAMATVAAAMQRKCWITMGHETIYPNLYIVLIGPAGGSRKGTALNIGKSILSEVSGVIVLPEATTREAMITTMRDGVQSFKDPISGKPKTHCAIAAFSEELSVLLGQKDIKFLSNLTDWYDSKDTWSYDTIGRGRDSIQGLCCTLLGATAPDWIQSMLPQEAIGGGFTSRIIFIVEERKAKTIPYHEVTAEEKKLRKSLVYDLARIHNMIGEFAFEQEALDSYMKWYEESDKRIEKGDYPVDDPRFASYCDRRQTHLRKMLMILSASRSDDMVITQKDFDRATRILVAAEQKMHKTFGGLGKSKVATEAHKIIEYIHLVKTTTRSVILQRFFRDVAPQDFKLIEDMMVQMRLVESRMLKGGDVVYTWIGK